MVVRTSCTHNVQVMGLACMQHVLSTHTGAHVCGEVSYTSGVLCSIRYDRQMMRIQIGVCLGVAQVQFGIFVIRRTCSVHQSHIAELS